MEEEMAIYEAEENAEPGSEGPMEEEETWGANRNYL